MEAVWRLGDPGDFCYIRIMFSEVLKHDLGDGVECRKIFNAIKLI